MNKRIVRTGALIVTAFLIASGCSSKPSKPTEPTQPTINTPEVAMALPEMESTPRGPSLTLNDLLFDFDSAQLNNSAQPLITRASAYLNENPDTIAVIEGHADSTGDASYNQNLSQSRAAIVKQALLSAGADQARVKASAFGETQPKSSNGTLLGRQQNRRVEIIFEQR